MDTTDNSLRHQVEKAQAEAKRIKKAKTEAKLIDILNHTHWIENNNDTITCARCGTWFHRDDRYFYMRYCPYCGKKIAASEG